MRYQNKIQQDISEYIYNDVRFYPTHNIDRTVIRFGTWQTGDSEIESDFIDLKKSHSGKTLAKVQIFLRGDNREEVGEDANLRILLYLNSYCEWDTFFEGWIENMEEFKIIMKSLGL